MRKHKGFTLVELVVVVMILGILAAVAAPKLLNTSSSAADNGIKQSLAVVRDAIERYAAQNGGELPGDDVSEADFLLDIGPFLRGEFPTCPVAGKNNKILVAAVAGDLAGEAGDEQDFSWAYSTTTGQFIVNSSEATNNKLDDVGVTYDEL